MLLRLLALATIPDIVNSLSISVARVQRRVGWIVLVQGMFAALVLTLSYIFLRVYGIKGVGFAMLASQSIVAVFVLLTRLRSVVGTERAITHQACG